MLVVALVTLAALMSGLSLASAASATDVEVADQLDIDVAELVSRADAWQLARHETHAEAVERADRSVDVANYLSALAEAEAEEAAKVAASSTTSSSSTTAAPEVRAPKVKVEAAPTTTAAPATTVAPITTVAPTTTRAPDTLAPNPGGPSADQWAKLRHCESSGNYQAVNPSGTYRGAYQFSIATWDWLAGKAYPNLVGIDPIEASNADQDAMALALYNIYGSSPWPKCGAHLN